jgi:hypothetical protein
MAYPSGKDKITRFKDRFQMIEELPLEQRRHYPDRNEEAFATGYPTISVTRQATAGDDTMEMGMIHEILTPGVQDADKADEGTKMFWIS